MPRSRWAELSIGPKVIRLLGGLSYGGRKQNRHLGRSFATGYQLAILLREKHFDTFQQLGLPVGGLGTGAPTSLAKYLSLELSRRIKNGELAGVIEGGFLSNTHLRQLKFEDNGEPVISSLTGGGEDVSLFRYIGE